LQEDRKTESQKVRKSGTITNMTKQTPLHRSAQSDKTSIPHRGGHTYTKSKNSLRRNSSTTIPQNQSSKNLKFVSKSCEKVAEAAFKKLDSSIPEQAKRLQNRRRMISYGKVRLTNYTYIFVGDEARRRKKWAALLMTTNHSYPLETNSHTLNFPSISILYIFIEHCWVRRISETGSQGATTTPLHGNSIDARLYPGHAQQAMDGTSAGLATGTPHL
jgi:hypothetical protein